MINLNNEKTDVNLKTNESNVGEIKKLVGELELIKLKALRLIDEKYEGFEMVGKNE